MIHDSRLGDIRLVAWIVAGGFALIALMVSVRLILRHHRHFTNPPIQSKIIGILWMVPIYAADSWLSLRFKDIALYLDMCRDCYESYVIYLFLALMISYLGEERVVSILNSAPCLHHPFPLSMLSSEPIKMGQSFLQQCKFATMQLVAFKPLVTLTAIVLEVRSQRCRSDIQGQWLVR